MRVFVTGATGYVGSAVARALLAHGHDVSGLARTRDGADTLISSGVRPVLGSLTDEDVLRVAVGDADAVVLAAFRRDYMTHFDEAVALDHAVVQTVVGALRSDSKPLVYTSGIGVLGDTGTHVVSELTAASPPPQMRWRYELEQLVLASGSGVVLRPALVYGRGGGHVVEGLIQYALKNGRAVYPTPGTNEWPNVHIDDVGEAFALAVAQAPPGSLFHVVGGSSTAKAMSEAIARLVGAPTATAGLPLDQARRELPFADYMTVNQRIDASQIKVTLEWRPRGPTITDDIATGSYRRLVRVPHSQHDL